MSKGKQLVFNTTIVGLSKISSVLAIFLALPIYTKYLTTEQYGYFDLVIVYGLLIVPIIMLRLEVAIFRWLVDVRKDEQGIAKVVTNVLQIIIISLLVFTPVYWIVTNVIDIQYPWLVYGYLVFAVLSGVTLQVARGLGRIKQFAVGGVMAGVSSMAIGAVFITVLDMRLDGILWGLMLGHILTVVYNVLAMRIWRYVHSETSRELKRELMSFSLPMVPNGLSGWVTLQGTRAIVATMLGVAANGIYAVSIRLTSLFSGLYEVFNTTWTESASVHIKAKDRDEFFTETINIALIFFGSIAIGVVAMMPIVFPLLVDDSFAQAYYYIPALMLGSFLDIIVRMLGAIYVALRLTKQVMYTTIAAAAISLVATLTLIPFMGLWGAVVASTVAFGALATFRYYDICSRGVSIQIRAANMLVLLVAYLIVSGVYYLDRHNLSLHLATTTLATIFILYVNRHVIGQIKAMMMGRLRK